jgi:molybdopterin-guanine dinucleotide biosynthesis protein A
LTQSPEILGLVLAGGRSRRFGRDKAAMQVQGQALLERTVNLLKPLVEEVYVSVRADQTGDRLRRRFRLLVDEKANQGPAGGLLAAHGHRPDAAWIVLACDLPFMDEEAVRYLMRSRNAGKDATAYRSVDDGLPEPLCAIYEPDTLARFGHQAGAASGLSPRSFLANADVEYIMPIRDRVLLNVNSPEDLLQIQNDGDAGKI